MNNNSITEKQKALIEKICDVLDVEFCGKTKQEASEFINKYLQQYIDEKEYLKRNY